MSTTDADRAIEVEGLAFAISPRGVDALLRGEGTELHLNGLNVYLSETALNAILARLAPADQPDALRADLSPDRVVVERREGDKTIHVDIGLKELRLRVGKDGLHVTGR